VNRFEVTNVSSDVVGAPREAIWDVLSDPALLAHLAPLVDRIDRVGDGHWRWQLTGIRALGQRFAPCFTVAMRFDEHDRIEFTHDPPAGATEHAGAEGVYDLADVAPGQDAAFPAGGTQVAIELTVHVDLPLPAVSRPAVTAVMERTMSPMGDRFASNLRRHLGVNR
jgi:carbon monoxide dehydrogenase subunit G